MNLGTTELSTQPSTLGEWLAYAMLHFPPEDGGRILELLGEFHAAHRAGNEEEIAEKRTAFRRAMVSSIGKYVRNAPRENIDELLSDLQFATLSVIKDDGKALSVIKDDGKTAKRKVQPRFEYPEPDKESELASIQERSSDLAHVSRTVAGLGLAGADVQVQITGLNELGRRCEALARHIGMHAVSEGNLTQRELARLLGVHELTVHRWVKAVQEQPAVNQEP